MSIFQKLMTAVRGSATEAGEAIVVDGGGDRRIGTSGEFVSVEDFVEYGDETGRIGRIVLCVHNRTEIPVYSAALSLELETDSRHYYTTVHDDRGVPPAMKIFIVVEFVYISPEERANIGGVTVADSYFL